jgi:ribosomal protein S8
MSNLKANQYRAKIADLKAEVKNAKQVAKKELYSEFSKKYAAYKALFNKRTYTKQVSSENWFSGIFHYMTITRFGYENWLNPSELCMIIYLNQLEKSNVKMSFTHGLGTGKNNRHVLEQLVEKGYAERFIVKSTKVWYVRTLKSEALFKEYQAYYKSIVKILHKHNGYTKKG